MSDKCTGPLYNGQFQISDKNGSTIQSSWNEKVAARATLIVCDPDWIAPLRSAIHFALISPKPLPSFAGRIFFLFALASLLATLTKKIAPDFVRGFVIPIGFEPMAYSLEGCRSIQLSYGIFFLHFFLPLPACRQAGIQLSYGIFLCVFAKLCAFALPAIALAKAGVKLAAKLRKFLHCISIKLWMSR